jgi:hypothetical protein
MKRCVIGRGIPLLLLSLCSVIASAADLPDGAQDWPAVVGRPALTEDEVARFLLANAVAEEMRQQAEDQLVADLPAYDRPGEGHRDPLAGMDFLGALAHAQRLTAGLEARACERAGIPFPQYRDTYKRLLQVNELTLLQLRIDGKRQTIGQLTASDIDTLAAEQLRFRSRWERDELAAELARLGKQRARADEIRSATVERRRRSLETRLQQLPQRQAALQQRLGQLEQARDHQQATLETAARVRREQHAAAAAGRVTAEIDHTGGETMRSKADRLQDSIDDIQRRLDRLAGERSELQAALAELDASSAAAIPEADPQMEREGEPLRQRIGALDAELARAPSSAEIKPLAAQLQQRLDEERGQLADLERQLQTPVMLQAQRDRDVAMRRAASLTASGTPILIEVPQNVAASITERR